MVHGTLPSYDIYVYEVSLNYFHLLQSYAPNNEMLRMDVQTHRRVDFR